MQLIRHFAVLHHKVYPPSITSAAPVM
jgi:hypothetical protein